MTQQNQERSGALPGSKAGALWDEERDAALEAIRDALMEWEEEKPDPIGRQVEAINQRLPGDMRELWPSSYHRYRKIGALRHISLVTLLSTLGYLRGDLPQALVDLAVRVRGEVTGRMNAPRLVQAGINPEEVEAQQRRRRALVEAFNRLPSERQADLVEMARLWARAAAPRPAGAATPGSGMSWADEEALQTTLDKSAADVMARIGATGQRARQRGTHQDHGVDAAGAVTDTESLSS